MSNEGPKLLMAGALYELCIDSKTYGERKRTRLLPWTRVTKDCAGITERAR